LLNKLEPAITETNPLVIAQNRTTHAVRALAIMLVAAPLISLIVGIALVFSLSNENNLALGFAVSLLGLFALIRVIVAALVELNKSKIPE
jgi:predicted neutral ceramidase superfamily lipid hydrolase